MKLYTEKELRKAIGKSRLSDGFVDGVFQLKYTIDEVLEQSLPIELPSDEEIGKEIDKLPFSKHVDDGLYNDGQLMGFELGAKWIKEQILNQNK